MHWTLQCPIAKNKMCYGKCRSLCNGYLINGRLGAGLGFYSD
uniref:Uncharacterized protein n=1 Tax=Rhizophora mucronata TaxID=61149 RepID=A0A2P2LDH8_RHIMU